MQGVIRTVLLWTVILSACSAVPAAPPTVSPPNPEHPTPLSTTTVPNTEPPFPIPTTAAPDPKPITTVGTPHIDQGPDGAITVAPPDTQNCGYQWAYQDLPRLSSRFQQALQTLQPEAQASAFAFGENCILSDGSVGGFLPMETDFNIILQTSDLNDESELGDWVIKVMEIITALPPDQIVGPRPGRVSLTFQSGGEEKNVKFYVNQYQELPPGLSPAEIFQQLQALQ